MAFTGDVLDQLAGETDPDDQQIQAFRQEPVVISASLAQP